MIIRAGAVVTMDGPPLVGGVVRVEGERIIAIGQSVSADDEIIELRDHILLPGLINAHCHLDYTILRGEIAPQNSFTDWIRAINAAKARLTPDDYVQSIDAGFGEALRFGTTSLVNFEAFPELVAGCAGTPLRTWWCAELIDVNAAGEAERMVVAAVREFAAGMPRKARWKRALPGEGAFGLAPHALFTASPELYRECGKIASANDWILTTHLAESAEEMEMFADGSGRLFDFLKSLGRDMSDCGGLTPLARFLQNAGGKNWILAHVNELDAGDLVLLAQHRAQLSLAHCPRSHAYFRHRPFAFEKLRDVNICLATDSLASNDDLSLLAEVRAFRKLHLQVSAAAVLETITINPARALGAADQLGRIRVGFAADMIALPMNGSADVYEQIAEFDGEIPWVMIRGKVAVG